MPDDKRYNFIKSGFDAIKEGVTAQFVYDQVLHPTQGLLEKISRALTLRSKDPNYSVAAEVMQNCINRIGVALNIPELTQKAHVSSEPQVDSENTISTSSFQKR